MSDGEVCFYKQSLHPTAPLVPPQLKIKGKGQQG